MAALMESVPSTSILYFVKGLNHIGLRNNVANAHSRKSVYFRKGSGYNNIIAIFHIRNGGSCFRDRANNQCKLHQ